MENGQHDASLVEDQLGQMFAQVSNYEHGRKKHLQDAHMDLELDVIQHIQNQE